MPRAPETSRIRMVMPGGAGRGVLGARQGGRLAGGWRRRLLFPSVVAAVLGFLLAAPGSLQHKAHLLLHGLCAQRPSHTLALGTQLLPFDARMTGIYSGFLVAALYLVGRGRMRAYRLPPRAVMFALGGAVAAMAFDGTNSLLVDLRLPHLYEPDNRLRLLTGLGTGTALAVALGFLLATTLWRRGDWERAAIAAPRELALIGLLQVPFALAALSGFGLLYAPLVLLLVASALAVVGSMALVVVLLLRRADRRYERAVEIQPMAVLALALAVVVMVGLAWGRVALEQAVGAPALT